MKDSPEGLQKQDLLFRDKVNLDKALHTQKNSKKQMRKNNVKALSHLIRFECELNPHQSCSRCQNYETELLLMCHTHCSPSNDFYPGFIEPTF